MGGTLRRVTSKNGEELRSGAHLAIIAEVNALLKVIGRGQIMARKAGFYEDAAPVVEQDVEKEVDADGDDWACGSQTTDRDHIPRHEHCQVHIDNQRDESIRQDDKHRPEESKADGEGHVRIDYARDARPLEESARHVATLSRFPPCAPCSGPNHKTSGPKREPPHS